MTPSEVLARLRQAAQNRPSFIFSAHAMDRAYERGITRTDVLKAFQTATHAEEQETGRWRISGYDEDNKEFTVIVAPQGLIPVVITVF